MDSKPAGPGRTGYVIAGVVFLLGIVGAGALVAVFVFGLMGLGENLDRFVAPGSAEMQFTETGGYTVYYEHRSQVDGVDYDTGESRPNIDLSVTYVEDGENIPVEWTSFSTNYDNTDRSGESLYDFDVDEPGRYEISAEYVDGRDGPPFVLAVGQGVGGDIVTSVGAFFAGGAVFCFLTVAALAIAGITLYRRSRAGQSNADASSPV